jgi:hypothetical protein
VQVACRRLDSNTVVNKSATTKRLIGFSVFDFLESFSLAVSMIRGRIATLEVSDNLHVNLIRRLSLSPLLQPAD